MIIGLIGYLGSGKTTVAKAAIPSNMARIGFADPMYDMIRTIVPAEIVDDKSRWNEPLDVLCGKTLRHAMQTLGTEWGRDCISEYFWAAMGVERAKRTAEHCILDNVRFPQEFDLIRKSGGKLIAFIRPAHMVDISHASERHIALLQGRADYTFYNRGTVAESAERFGKVLAEIINDGEK